MSRFSGSRGRVAYAGQEFALGEFTVDEDVQLRAPEEAILLAVSENGEFKLAVEFDALKPGQQALIMVPLAPFRKGKDTLAAAAERFLRGC
jgi:hypothetical protein